jgi:hypothetical protein
VIKAIGNLIYYRFINPALIAPETSGVIEVSIDDMHRKGLAQIAKILQAASAAQVCNASIQLYCHSDES